jgi:hypothetical protein
MGKMLRFLMPCSAWSAQNENSPPTTYMRRRRKEDMSRAKLGRKD